MWWQRWFDKLYIWSQRNRYRLYKIWPWVVSIPVIVIKFSPKTTSVLIYAKPGYSQIFIYLNLLLLQTILYTGIKKVSHRKEKPHKQQNYAICGVCILFKLWDFIVPLSLKLSKNTLFSIHFSMRYGIFPSVPEVKCIICVSRSNFSWYTMKLSKNNIS